MGEYSYFFGYSNHPEKENKYSFHNFDSHDEELLHKFEGFKEFNKEQKKYLLENKEAINKIEFLLNKPGPPLFIPDFPTDREILKKMKIKDM